MSSSQVIANYQSLSALSGQMRQAAARGDWDQLIGIEQERGKLFATTRPLDAEVALDEAVRQRKTQLIHEIMANDAEIRNLVQTWMKQLELSIQSNRQEQRLQRTYGV